MAHRRSWQKENEKKETWHSFVFGSGLPGSETVPLEAQFGESLELNAPSVYKNTTPPHTPSQHGRQPRETTQTADQSFRPRVSTMPSPRRRNYSPASHVEMSERRVRSYSVSAKGMKITPDRSRSVRRQPSNASVSSWSSSSESRDRTLSRGSVGSNLTNASSDSFSSLGATKYSVAMVGSQGVGKTALVNQFVTSEQSTPDEDYYGSPVQTKGLSITLEGETSDIIFHDHPASQIPPEIVIRDKDVDAYVVVYSVTDGSSFSRAKSILAFLHHCDLIQDKAVILVGNKTDLVRARIVDTEEGKQAAVTYECKFIETSDWMSHNVDNLLVGILSQIRLKLKRHDRQEKKKEQLHRYKGSKTSLSRSRSVVRELFRKLNSKSKSCDNLQVL